MIARLRLVAVVIVVLLCGNLGSVGQSDPIQWSLKAKPTAIRGVGQKLTLFLDASISEGWHLYSINQGPGGPAPTRIVVSKGQLIKVASPIQEPQPQVQMDPNFGIMTEFFEETATFKIPVKVFASPAAQKQEVRVDVVYQICNDRTCLPPKLVTAKTVLTVIGQGPKPAATEEPTQTPLSIRQDTNSLSSGPAAAPSTTAVQPSLVSPGANVSAAQQSTKAQAIVPTQSLGSFVWLAAVMGALSLLTPCVFPMIPITVSYFTKNAGTSRRSATFTALVYGIGIILTFTALGMFLAVVFGAGGVNQLAANPWVNLLISAIFLGFAFSLFGAYFIQVPSGLMNKLDAITRSKEGSGAIGALLMGFTFTLTSFTCTAPFVGTLLVMTAQGNWHWPLVGMLAFSTVFAIPFFLLALAPQLMSRLPKAGGWMVSIKVVMGFLEIAAAMKFLSNADLVWHWGIFTRQVVLAVWVGIGLLTVLYVLGYFRMTHDSPIDSVGAARITVAIIFLATTIWLIPGLFGRQLGELESFLPPEIGSPTPGAQSASNADPHTDARWVLNDYEGALTTAKQQNKLVFVDFTGYTCTNCRWMEANMFPRPEIASEMGRFVRLRLYTDGDGEIYERQQKMQQQKFGTVALPFYAILRPDGSAVSTFPGLTRNSAEFLAFLQQGETPK